MKPVGVPKNLWRAKLCETAERTIGETVGFN